MWRIVSFGVDIGHRARSVQWQKGRTVAAAAAVTAVLAGTSVAGAPAASASLSETVIVTATGLLSPAAAVLRVGGSVLTQYHLINGVAASIPSITAPVLDALPGITVTPDVSVSVQSTTESTGPHTPSDAFLPETGATRLAASGDTGQGVTVAVLDTGIDKLPDFSGRLIGGVDLTSGNDPLPGQLRARHVRGGPDRRQWRPHRTGSTHGEAPGANLVSIKVAGLDGTTHLGTLILGLQWAVDHQRIYDIKVLNISLGYQSDKSTVDNPLDQAVEAVWNVGHHGGGLGGQRRAVQRHHPVPG